MIKKIIAAALCMVLALPFAACGNDGAETSQDGAVKVYTTFDAMYEFVKAVGGDKVEVVKIIPDGSEPHDFEPKAQDMAGLSDADVFIYNGLGIETWADEAVEASGNDGLVVMQASKGIDLIETAETDENGSASYDPHVWLSLKCAMTEAENIRDALIEASPSDSDYFESNCDEFVAQLQSLYDQYSEKFETVSGRYFVTGHAAFAYLCRDFGLTQKSVENVFAEGEPTALQLAELADFCRENGVKTIFSEELASPSVSRTLAEEVGASVETIYTMESAEDDMNYLERMQANLEKIYQSLLEEE